MTDYPAIPHRPNFVDIRTWQIFDEAGNSNDQRNHSDWTQLSSAGATLESGVTIRNFTPNSLFNSCTVGYYNDHTHTGTTGGAGYELAMGEEVFVPVRQLSHIYIKRIVGTIPTGPWITWRAS